MRQTLSALLAAVALLCLAPAPALATVSTTSPSAAEIADARAEADAIAAAAGVQDLFDNVTDSRAPALRHRASGVVCTFEPHSPVNRIVILGDLARGDHLGCSTRIAGFVQSLYMTRYSEPMSADQVLANSVIAIHQVHPDARPYTGETIALQGPTAPAIKTARFIFKVQGVDEFSRSSAAGHGDWMITLRVTGPLDNAMAGDLLSEATLVNILAPPRR
ncbi:MAG: hypothetical protein JWP35_86 [Caulobacter sp.]|nr:hypothetical protein [Caulobacter sp.]